MGVELGIQRGTHSSATIFTLPLRMEEQNTLREMRNDLARMNLIRTQMRETAAARQERLEATPNEGANPIMRTLSRVVGIGAETADMLAHEVLSRDLRDRRAVARYAGLTGSPDESGARRR